MALEVLRAQLKAAGNLKDELGQTAIAARGAADEFDDLGDEANNAGASAAVFSEGLDRAGDEAAELAAKEAIAAQQTESLGDEFLQTAAQSGILRNALDETGDELSGFNGRLSRIAGIAAVATPAVLGLGAAIGGLGAAGATLGVGVLGISAAGIEARAEETARLSDELETVADAREQILGDFRSRLGDAFEPLQNAQAETFAFNNLDAIVQIADNAADSLLRLQDTVIDVGSAFRATLVDVSGATFTELARQGERLAPLLLQLRSAIRDIPGLIRFLGDAAARIGPDLFNLAGALGRITAGVTALGVDGLALVLPPLNGFLELVATAADTFRGLPDSLRLGITAFVGLTAAVAAFSAAASLAAGAVAVLAAPISATVLAVAAITAGVVILLEELGLLKRTLNLIANPLDGFNDLIDSISDDVGSLVPDIKLLNKALEAVGLNAEKANKGLENLNPSANGQSEDKTQPTSAKSGGIGEFVKNAGILGTAFGLIGAGAGTLIGPGPGTVVGGTAGVALGTSLAAAANPRGSGSGNNPSLDADASGQDAQSDPVLPNQPNQPFTVNNDITVNGTSNPAQTRTAVRRAVETANKQQRNAEDGRVD